MHPCLNLDEIVRLIAGELVASKANSAAAALACCRKSFEDPVLDVLWETQERLFPLQKTLPGDVWSEVGCFVSRPNNAPFPFPQPFYSKGFQKTPDNPRMGSFPEVLSKDAKARRTLRAELPVGGSVVGFTVPQHQRTPFSEYEGSRAVAHWERHPIYPLVPFPQNHHHQPRVF